MHQVTDGGPLPAYIRRPHDDLLDAVLDPAVAGSRLIVVRGGSSTGKTRAACEAVTRGALARWRLEYPLHAAALNALLDAGIPTRTILWLGELRQYTGGEDGGAAVLGRLARLVEGQNHVIAVTTMWPEQWDSYIDASRGGAYAQPTETAGRLLARLPELTSYNSARIDPARGGVIEVPAVFTAAEIVAAIRTGDQVLADAASAAARAGQAGQLAQYLPASLICSTATAGPAGTRTGKRSSPPRWTRPGSAAKTPCPPLSCWTPRPAT